jgi:hypothetical protein
MVKRGGPRRNMVQLSRRVPQYGAMLRRGRQIAGKKRVHLCQRPSGDDGKRPAKPLPQTAKQPRQIRRHHNRIRPRRNVQQRPVNIQKQRGAIGKSCWHNEEMVRQQSAIKAAKFPLWRDFPARPGIFNGYITISPY